MWRTVGAIGGSSATPAAANLTAINAIMSEWIRTSEITDTAAQSFAVRVGHLRDGTSGGLNGTAKLNSSTVHDDAGAIDTLKGSSPPTPNTADLDWLFKSTGDLMDALVTGEILTTI